MGAADRAGVRHRPPAPRRSWPAGWTPWGPTPRTTRRSSSSSASASPTVLGVMRQALPTRAAACRSRTGAPARLLFVGRGVPNKAQHHLVMASAALARRGTRPPLVARRRLGRRRPRTRPTAGSWPAALGVDDRVRSAGSVTEAELGRSYADADLFLCLSDHEGFCVPLLEAMAAGAADRRLRVERDPRDARRRRAAPGRQDRRRSSPRRSSRRSATSAWPPRLAAARPAQLRRFDRPRSWQPAWSGSWRRSPERDRASARAIPAAAGGVLSRLEDALRRTGVLDAGPRGASRAGLDDPGLAARAGAPFAVMPLLRGRRPPPWAAALLGAAAGAGGARPGRAARRSASGPSCPWWWRACRHRARRRPEPACRRGPAPERLVAGCGAQEGAAVPTGGPGIAWVGGGAAAALPAAVEAWAEGRAVVALPGTTPHRHAARTGVRCRPAPRSRPSKPPGTCARVAAARAGAGPARQARGVRAGRPGLVAGRFAEAIVMAGEPG